MKKRKKYAIVDIETTGGMPKRDRIIEIGVVVFDGKEVVDTFSSLVHPERSIPNEITRITGIDNGMVADAPRFYEIAKKVVEITEDTIFVAHNVNFDYSFIKEEFANLGYTFSKKQLCTVKLTRKTFPGLKSYSLGNLIDHFGFKVKARHRAFDDAYATMELLGKIFEQSDTNAHIESLVNRGVRETRLPNGISLEAIHSLPEGAGVYYMFNEHGRIIYIGKSINIRSRMMQHFAATTRKTERMLNEVKNIDYILTGSELIAILLESYEIKAHLPEINRAQRTKEYPYFIYIQKDKEGYINFNVDKVSIKAEKDKEILGYYSSKVVAKSVLGGIRANFLLCETRLNGHSPIGRPCIYHKMNECEGACISEEDTSTYNERAKESIASIQNVFDHDMIILVEGRSKDERGVILIEDRHFRGYGYIDTDGVGLGVEELKEAIDPMSRNIEANNLIFNYIATKKNLKLIKI